MKYRITYVIIFLILCTGTSKGTELYKIGTKETNVMLEILNLDKKEVIAIDGISNQEFSQVINYGPFKLSFELG